MPFRKIEQGETETETDDTEGQGGRRPGAPQVSGSEVDDTEGQGKRPPGAAS